MKYILLFFIFISTQYCFSNEYIITKYGAKESDEFLNTHQIQALIDKVSEDGGGTIVVPKGEFFTGALFFKPGTHLKLEEGATLKGSDDISNYPLIPSRMEGQSIYYYAALINAYNVDNFTIEGPGTIDGNGLKFWESFWERRKENPKCTNLEVKRPRLIFLWECNDVKIQNVKLHNSGFWTTHLYQCQNVLIENCHIYSPSEPVPAPSTDGVDLDVCKDVKIKGCYISVNDDGVCIKGGKGPNAQSLPENGTTENVLVEDCEFGFVHSTLTLGSECIHAKNITMRNCKVNHNRPLLRLKNRPDTYQLFENITVENITGKCKELINVYPWKQFYDMKGSENRPFCTVNNIVFNNIEVSTNSLGVIRGNKDDKINNITFKNIKLTTEKETLDTSLTNIKFENVVINGKKPINGFYGNK